jgi:hypothetical protein
MKAQHHKYPSISTFVKIRISNSNLNIEKGRYLNTPAEDRICKLCNSGVEDEFHFTNICSKLQSSIVDNIIAEERQSYLPYNTNV